MRIDRLGDLGSAPEVLRAVGDAANRLESAAAGRADRRVVRRAAVIAPSVAIGAVDADDVFDVRRRVRTRTTVGGGWIGYLSYPDRGLRRPRPARVPEAAGGWTDCVLRCDRDRQWWYESLSGAPMPGLAGRGALRLSDAGARMPDRLGRRRPRGASRRGAGLPGGHRAPARSTRPACARSSPARIDGPPLDFFLDGVARTAPARAAYVAGDVGRGGVAVAGAVPSAAAAMSVTSSPIKGTLPLYALPRRRCAASIKDVAENIMIVDLVRNDLGRVAITGSVTVPELLAVRPAPGVWHLVSTVSAQVPTELPMTDAAGRHVPARHRSPEHPNCVPAS